MKNKLRIFQNKKRKLNKLKQLNKLKFNNKLN